jgi:hypothetical protein
MSTNSCFLIEEFKAVRKDSLRGFARVRLPSGMILHDTGIYYNGETWWAAPPSKPVLDRSGRQIVKAGKRQYQPTVSFVSRGKGDCFTDGVIAALRVSHPEVFDEERQLIMPLGAITPPALHSHTTTTWTQGVAQ